MERIYTVPLGDAYKAVRNKRVPRAVKLLREFAQRHMKARNGRVLLSAALNEFLWKRSIQKPPRYVKVRMVKKGEDVSVFLADEKIAEEKAEKKEEQKKEAAEEKEVKEEKKETKQTKKESEEHEKERKEKDKGEGGKKEQTEKREGRETVKEEKKSENEESGKPQPQKEDKKES